MNMNKMFYNTEYDRVESIMDLFDDYSADVDLQSEYATFSDYVKCCMVSEGGVLEEVR